MKGMHLHITGKCIPLLRKITKSTRTTEMVNPLVTTEMVTLIEREAGVDVVDEAEAVEMAEEEDMLISKRSNLLHSSNLPHRKAHHHQ